MIKSTFGSETFETVEEALAADTTLTVDTLGELRQLTKHLPDDTKLRNCDGYSEEEGALVTVGRYLVIFYTVS